MKGKLLFSIAIILLLAAMIGYNVYDFQQSKEAQKPFLREVSLTAEYQKWLDGKKEIIISYDEAAVPFVKEGEDGEAYGFLQDYFEIISKKLGVGIVLQKNAEESHVRIVIARGEIAEDGQNTMPILPAKGVLCTSMESGINAMEEVKGVTASAIGGSEGEKAVLAGGYARVCVPASSIAEGMQMLEEGQAKVFAGNEGVIRDYLLQNERMQEYRVLPGYLYEGNYCLFVPNENKPLFGVLNSCVYNINKGAVFPELMGRWMGFSYPLYAENAAERPGMIFLIVAASMICLFGLFYISNRGLYAELTNQTEVLLASKRELEATFNGVTYYIAEVDTLGKILSINKAFSQELNIKSVEAVGHHITEFLNVDAVKKGGESLPDLIQSTFREEIKMSGEFTGHRKFFTIHTFPIQNSRGQTTKVLLMIMDVTKERSAERQMLQDNKMIAIGQLASGVAHEIRNPLGMIMNYCYVLKNLDIGDDSTRLEAIQIIEKSVKRSGKIIDNLLDLSRPASGRRERVILKAHVQAILSLHGKFSEKNNISVDFACPDDIVLYTEVDSLDMVILNLLVNAGDAIEDSGTIRIQCAQNDRETTIEVSDTGIGIHEDIIGEIFNPFFTTKQRREGNGLGLYIVYNEIQKLNGNIDVESEPGAGTTFTVTLPNGEAGEG